jgi:TPR repeat protein
VRAWRAQLAQFLLAALLSACAAPPSYMGISFGPGAAASDLQDLARRAQAGYKQAQLDLGIAYEEGLGTAIDVKKARKLYRKAGADIGSTSWIYVPSVRKGEAGRLAQVNLGLQQSGLREAKARLERMQGKLR